MSLLSKTYNGHKGITAWWWPKDSTVYLCPVVSARGKECVHEPDHGLMHKAENGYSWRSK